MVQTTLPGVTEGLRESREEEIEACPGQRQMSRFDETSDSPRSRLRAAVASSPALDAGTSAVVVPSLAPDISAYFHLVAASVWGESLHAGCTTHSASFPHTAPPGPAGLESPKSFIPQRELPLL